MEDQTLCVQSHVVQCTVCVCQAHSRWDEVGTCGKLRVDLRGGTCLVSCLPCGKQILFEQIPEVCVLESLRFGA